MTDRPASGEPRAEFWFAQGTLIHGRDRGGIDIGPLIGEARTEASARSIVEQHNAMVRKARATAPPTYLNPSQVRTVVEVMARSLLRRYPQLRVSVPELMTGLDIAIEEARLSEQPGADS